MQALRGVSDAEFLKSVGATREEVQELARLLLSLSDVDVEKEAVPEEGEVLKNRAEEGAWVNKVRDEGSDDMDKHAQREKAMLEAVRREFQVVTPENGTIVYLSDAERQQGEQGVEVWIEVDTGPLVLGFPEGGALNVVIGGISGAPTLSKRFPVILSAALCHMPVPVLIQALDWYGDIIEGAETTVYIAVAPADDEVRIFLFVFVCVSVFVCLCFSLSFSPPRPTPPSLCVCLWLCLYACMSVCQRACVQVPSTYSIGALPSGLYPIPRMIEEARHGSTLTGIKFLFPPDGALLEVVPT